MKKSGFKSQILFFLTIAGIIGILIIGGAVYFLEVHQVKKNTSYLIQNATKQTANTLDDKLNLIFTQYNKMMDKSSLWRLVNQSYNENEKTREYNDIVECYQDMKALYSSYPEVIDSLYFEFGDGNSIPLYKDMFLEQKDLTEDIEGLPKYVKALKEKYGKFAGLAYCAGMGGIQPIRAVEYEQIQKVFSVNYFAPVFMVKGMLDKRNNIGAGTSIVCVASAGGVKCDPGMTSYAGSKGALIASMESIAKEVASSKIRVNCVSPTLINTQMADDIARQYAEGKYPMGIGEVDDVANYIAFLLSDKTKWIAAKNYIIDCGVF